MRHLKTLAITAAAAALTATFGVAVAQSSDQADPMATPQDVTNPQQVDVTGASNGQQIYFFRDQGNAPETDPAAHLMLIKHDQMRAMPVAQSTTTTTTVAQTTAAAPEPAPVAVNDTSANNTTDTTDTTAMPADTTPALAPKADRN